MTGNQLKLLLAEDDPDDRFFFQEILNDISLPTELTAVQNGEELISLLEKNPAKNYNVLFLDLNMPRKNGFEVLSEMEENEDLKDLPVIILSTSNPVGNIDLLYSKGVKYYIQKPIDIVLYRKAIKQALEYIDQKKLEQPPKDKFIIPH